MKPSNFPLSQTNKHIILHAALRSRGTFFKKQKAVVTKKEKGDDGECMSCNCRVRRKRFPPGEAAKVVKPINQANPRLTSYSRPVRNQPAFGLVIGSTSAPTTLCQN